MNGSTFAGTIGLDTDPLLGTVTFTGPVDLSGFTNAGFVGLGSSSTAILSGAITPTNSSTYPNDYVFGGGGGTLTVNSNLTDNAGTAVVMNYGGLPLTLNLDGANNYTGTTTVKGGVLVFGGTSGSIPYNPGSASNVLAAGNQGYIGVGMNTGWNNGDGQTAFTGPQQWVGLFSTAGTTGIIGFDGGQELTGPISLAGFTSAPFLGTSSSVYLEGPITPTGTAYRFSGALSGYVTVDTDLNDLGRAEPGQPGHRAAQSHRERRIHWNCSRATTAFPAARL